MAGDFSAMAGPPSHPSLTPAWAASGLAPYDAAEELRAVAGGRGLASGRGPSGRGSEPGADGEYPRGDDFDGAITLALRGGARVEGGNPYWGVDRGGNGGGAESKGMRDGSGGRDGARVSGRKRGRGAGGGAVTASDQLGRLVDAGGGQGVGVGDRADGDVSASSARLRPDGARLTASLDRSRVWSSKPTWERAADKLSAAVDAAEALARRSRHAPTVSPRATAYPRTYGSAGSHGRGRCPLRGPEGGWAAAAGPGGAWETRPVAAVLLITYDRAAYLRRSLDGLLSAREREAQRLRDKARAGGEGGRAGAVTELVERGADVGAGGDGDGADAGAELREGSAALSAYAAAGRTPTSIASAWPIFVSQDGNDPRVMAEVWRRRAHVSYLQHVRQPGAEPPELDLGTPFEAGEDPKEAETREAGRLDPGEEGWTDDEDEEAPDGDSDGAEAAEAAGAGKRSGRRGSGKKAGKGRRSKSDQGWKLWGKKKKNKKKKNKGDGAGRKAGPGGAGRRSLAGADLEEPTPASGAFLRRRLAGAPPEEPTPASGAAVRRHSRLDPSRRQSMNARRSDARLAEPLAAFGVDEDEGRRTVLVEEPGASQGTAQSGARNAQDGAQGGARNLHDDARANATATAATAARLRDGGDRGAGADGGLAAVEGSDSSAGGARAGASRPPPPPPPPPRRLRVPNGSVARSRVMAGVIRRRAAVREVYGAIASHYGAALRALFDCAGFERVLVVEDDMDFARDFFSYFAFSARALDLDGSLLAASAWHDHGQARFGGDPRVVARTDFFPGLGWMARREVWQERLEGAWPEAYWDDWLRSRSVRGDGQFLRPEVCRTYTFGEHGSSGGQYYERFLEPIVLNETPIDWDERDPREVADAERYARAFAAALAHAPVARSAAEAWAAGGAVVLRYPDKATYLRYAAQLGLMTDWRDAVPRASYRGVITVRNPQGHRVFVAPEPGLDLRAAEAQWAEQQTRAKRRAAPGGGGEVAGAQRGGSDGAGRGAVAGVRTERDGARTTTRTAAHTVTHVAQGAAAATAGTGRGEGAAAGDRGGASEAHVLTQERRAALKARAARSKEALKRRFDRVEAKKGEQEHREAVGRFDANRASQAAGLGTED